MIEGIEFNSTMNESGIRFTREELAGLNSNKNPGLQLAKDGNDIVIDRGTKILMRFNVKIRFG